MESGIFLIDKTQGLSSAQELGKLKRKLSLTKVGHAGTLDPMATGLLVCLSGSATRLASYAEKGRKVYSGTIRFGLSTATDDIEGEVIGISDIIPSESEVQEKLPQFIGEIEQVPPSVSALKVSGVRAYKIARRGEDPGLKARKVSINKFELKKVSDSEFGFTVECGSGTYIRSIARDLGVSLGSLACLSSLRREYSSPFLIQNAKKTEDISSSDCRPWIDLFPHLNRVCFERAEAKKLICGDIRNIAGRLSDIIKEQVKEETGTLIYFDDSIPRGILKNNHGNWEIAVNIV